MSGYGRRPETLKLTLQLTGAAVALAALALAATPPASAAPIQAERLTFNLMVGGLHVGDALVALNQTAAGYTTEMRMTARGVAKWVRNFRTDMKGEGHFATSPAANGLPEFAPRPGTYVRLWSTGEVASDMTMTFDPQTGMAATSERLFNPNTGATLQPEDMPWNNNRRDRDSARQVPPDMRTNVLDPMAAFVAARGQIMAQGATSRGLKAFRVPVYDGRRRYDVIGKTGAVRAVTINGAERQLVPLTATIQPIFGFGQRSQERMKASEGKFLFTADDRFIPVQLTVSNEMISGVMNLTADCAQNAAPCDTFGQEPAPK
ncbi:MAG: DUF3108 domain-containing protein [Rhodospirillaceae bacterium]|nr:DUF3108 domain-containing protein [Rhodospirillaceae bacterium]